MKPAIPRPPEDLSSRARVVWRAVHRDYVLVEHEVSLLVEALRALDRADRARGLVASEGEVVPGRYGPRAHPAVAIERDARLAYSRLLRELNLQQPAEGARLPRIGGR